MPSLKVPPHSIDAEKSVLGAILIDKDLIFTIAPILSPEDFYKEAHQKIFMAISELNEKREPNAKTNRHP